MYVPDNVHIIGLDCAADPCDIAVAFAKPAGERLTIESVFRGKGGNRPRSERLFRLAREIAGRIKRDHSTLLAIDAPLGWPVTMGPALNAHYAGLPLKPCAKMFFRRRTDRFVEARTGKTPIEVGANLIARVSHTALRLIALMGDELDGHIAPAPLFSPTEIRNGVQVIEVYPALVGPFFLDCSSPRAPSKEPKKPATGDTRKRCWKALSARLKNLKNEDWQATQKRIEARLSVDTPSCPSDSKFWNSGPSRDHGLDAILCAWTAWRFVQGECVQPRECGEPESTTDQLSREGWIVFDERT